MANFQYAGTQGGVSPDSGEFVVVAGTESIINQGDIVFCEEGQVFKVSDGGASTGDIGSYGLAESDSTETASADGKVLVQFCPSGLLVRGNATDPGSLTGELLFQGYNLNTTGDTGEEVQTVDTGSGGLFQMMPATGAENFLGGTQVKISLPWAASSG